MYLDMYKIDGTINNDTEPCFGNPETYPNFQEELEEFKHLLIELVYLNEPKHFINLVMVIISFLEKNLWVVRHQVKEH